MFSVIRPTLSAARNSFSRTMSSLAPGCTLQGARWDYRILTPIKGDNTHISTVFKAEVIPRENAGNTPKAPPVVLALPSDVIAKENMDRERQTYHLPGINSADCFREMYDKIESTEYIYIYSLIMAVLRASLTSCILLEGHQRVNTDYKPANILLSGIETGSITAKVGDLGLVVPVGSLFNAQPYAMRAPEVFLGQACTEPSQVWAVATMLLCWIKPGILGAWNSPHPLLNEAWCMAKIKQLFPHWSIPTPNKVEKHSLEAAVDAAKSLSKEPDLQGILPFDKEIQKVEMPQQLRDLLRFMLVVNPVERPSPSSVLASREFRSFEEFVKSSWVTAPCS
ncbi:hypothetical protein BDV28DRAFT_157211 [Aspergillus coremiiformis]|uniref:Protein kinase domain-containing protein n=1 Tax=Aspergillus coremiiformis TaxID=138285 RepID=A0A5N6Z7R1_9EURO|nr:hypothetical protein BDV28DRAFT_157211 [Aspergillus coremiiformis]